MHFDLVDDWGYPIPQEELYVPHFRSNCATCGSRLICNGAVTAANACDSSETTHVPSVQAWISRSGYLRRRDISFYQSFVIHRPCRLQ